MLFFRSEEALGAWCRNRGHPPGPAVTLEQLWRLAAAWYSTRLDDRARRPQPDEMVAIFAECGLVGAFWDPRGDRFG